MKLPFGCFHWLNNRIASRRFRVFRESFRMQQHPARGSDLSLSQHPPRALYTFSISPQFRVRVSLWKVCNLQIEKYMYFRMHAISHGHGTQFLDPSGRGVVPRTFLWERTMIWHFGENFWDLIMWQQQWTDFHNV